MTEYTNIPSSPACGQWETLLADALDGLLKPEQEAVFNAHKANCPACAALYDAARRGREWLEFLSPEPEVPAGLLDKILARTGPGQAAGLGLVTDGGNVIPMAPTISRVPAWQRPGLMGSMRRFAEPRLLMTAAMAFFSIALTLNLTGIHLSSVRFSDLRPGAVRSFMERRLTTASTPFIRYYDHLRVVYEVESRMRELRRATQGDMEENQRKPKDAAPGESKHMPTGKDGGSRVEPPQQSVSPTSNDSDYLETSLTFQDRSAHSGGSHKEIRERSTVWTA
jgi:hypothetical protein